MKPRHQVSKAAVELIKTFEGYRSKSAQLPDGRWTIGFGHTLTAREGAQVSEQDAEALLLYDLIAVAHAVNEQTFTPLTQNQFDSLCCFAFNVGLDNFKRSSVLRRVNEGSLLQAACAMEMWRKADFEGERIVVDALVRRRSAEKTLFLTPANGWVPAPSPIVRPKVDYDAVNFVPRQVPTALNAPMTGDKAVVERETPASGVIPLASTTLASTAAMTAAAAVTSRLAQIVPEPEPARPSSIEVIAPTIYEPAPQPFPEAAAVADQPAQFQPFETVAEPAPQAEGLSWSPSAHNDAGPAAEDEADDAFASDEDPVLDIDRTPAQPTAQPAHDALAFPPAPTSAEVLPGRPESYTPYPATPVLAVGNGDRAFILTPAAEFDEAAAHPEPLAPFNFQAPANESEPGLFDISSQPFDTAGRSQGLLNEDHIRRLVEEDERGLAENLDSSFAGATLEPARIVGLPWLGAAALGVVVCGGGVAWGYLDRSGNAVTSSIAWGLGIVGVGVFLYAAWRWLEELGMPALDDEDEDQPAQ